MVYLAGIPNYQTGMKTDHSDPAAMVERRPRARIEAV
jgi:hypothetical protein